MHQVNYFKLKGDSNIYFFEEVLMKTFNEIVGECHEFINVRVVSHIPRNVVESGKMVVQWQNENDMPPTYPHLFISRCSIDFLGQVMIDHPQVQD